MIRLLGALSIALFVSSDTYAAGKRNIVMIVADDHGPDLGCYGNKDVKTPHLDALAADGTRFDLAFCTTASCSASRSVILSGLHNHLNGQYGHQHHYHHFSSFPSVKSLPVLLSAAGYRTARIGKYHVAPEEVYKFDVHLRGNPGGDRNGASMTEQCRELFAAADDKPVFLYFATSDPHRGGGVVAGDPLKPDRFGNGPKYEDITELTYDPATLKVPPFLPDTPACRAELAQYYQSISRVDQGVGKLLRMLKETNQYDNTLILYLSDNGMAFPGSKTTLYEPGMRLPLIVRSPDQKTRGGTSDAMVAWTDLAPTILAFAGVNDVPGPPATASPGDERPAQAIKAKAKPYQFHGRSFLQELDRPKSEGWDEVFASHTFHEITMYYPMRVLRLRQYKLIFNIAHQLPYPFATDLEASATWKSITKDGDAMYGQRKVKDFLQRPRWELYDLQTDPHEAKNLAADPKHAETLAKMQTRLKELQQRTGDPWVHKYEYE